MLRHLVTPAVECRVQVRNEVLLPPVFGRGPGTGLSEGVLGVDVRQLFLYLDCPAKREYKNERKRTNTFSVNARMWLRRRSALKNAIREGTPGGCWNGWIGSSQYSSSHSIGESTSKLKDGGKNKEGRINNTTHSSYWIAHVRPMSAFR